MSNRILNITFLIMLLAWAFCLLYDTLYYKRKMFNERNNTPVIHATEHKKGEVEYIIFSSPNGSIHVVNYSLDSMDYEAHKKFDK